MDYFAKIPHADALIDAIRVASLDVQAQVEWLRTSGFHFAEIHLQMRDFYHPVRGFIEGSDEFDFPEGVEEAILDVLERVEALMEVGGLGCLGDSPPSALSSSGWAEIRDSAEALTALLRESEWSGLVADG